MGESFSIRGMVVDFSTGLALSGARVEVWAESGASPPALDHTVSDSRGDFALEVTTRGGVSRGDVVSLRVFVAERELQLDRHVREWILSPVQAHVRLAVAADDQNIVRGRVVHPLRGPLARCQVVALHRRLGRTGIEHTELGSAVTDAGGRFRITYPHRGDTNLVVRAMVDDEVRAESELFCPAPRDAIVDLQLSGRWKGGDEFSDVTSGVASKLKEAGRELESLSDAELELLACAEGVSRDKLSAAAEALRSSRRHRVPASPLFALARAGLPTDPRRLMGHSRDDLRDVLERAATAGTLVADAATLNEWQRALDEARVRAVIEAGDALGASTTAADVQREFVRAYLEADEHGDAWWERLQNPTPERRSTTPTTPFSDSSQFKRSQAQPGATKTRLATSSTSFREGRR